jgi:Cytochrome C'
MKLHAQVQVLGIVALAASIWFLAVAGSGSAAKDDPKAKEIQGIVLKLAEAIEKDNAAEIKKQTAELQKHELLGIMKMLKLRANGGIGVGQPGAVTPDGIEAKLINISRKPMPGPQAGKEGADLAKAAYIMAAIAEVSKTMCPVKKKTGDKDPKEWEKWNDEMSKYSRDLAKAAQAKNANQIKDAAAKLNSSCNSCHGVFRD